MSPIHSAVTRRHVLKAFGVAAVALALPAERTPGIFVKPHVADPDWTIGRLKLGDVIEIDGYYAGNPPSRRQQYVVTGCYTDSIGLTPLEEHAS